LDEGSVAGQRQSILCDPIFDGVGRGGVARVSPFCAYSLSHDRHRADIHLRIGRELLARMSADQLAEHPFDVVSQFNRATALITLRDEREQMAQLKR
jgi:hypothetical protein